MKISRHLSWPTQSAGRWSRRLGVVVVVGAAGVAATPAQSFAPAASIAVSQNHDGEGATPDQEPADAAVQASSTTALAGRSSVGDIPAPAMRAYRFAAAVLARTDAACGLDWSLLAAIGDVESDHGRFGDAAVHTDGTSTPRILGPRLDGNGDVAAIADTDDGNMDADKRWDRAVGPMQFIPSTWAVVGSDADGNGTRDPHDLDDAALSAAAYLCAGDGDLSTVEGQRAAVYRYNPSRAYVDLVLELAAAYAEQSIGLTLPTPEAAEDSVRVPTLESTIDRPAHPAAPPREDPSTSSSTTLSAHRAAADTPVRSDRGSSPRPSDGSKHGAWTDSPGGGSGSTGGDGPTTGGSSSPPTGPGGGGSPGTADPAPGSDSPDTGSTGAEAPDNPPDGGATGDGSTGDGGSTGDPAPQPPPSVSGTLQRAGDGTWSVGGNTVDFGDDAYLDGAALHDFDGADGVESNRAELETLLDRDVTVVLDEGSQVVVQLNDLAYR